MKWGVRRYQNKDGSLTNAGKKRQAKLDNKAQKKERKATKRRDKYLDYTRIMANNHKYGAKGYAKNIAYVKSMSDSDYAKRYDDKDYLELLGGVKKAKEMEIKEYQEREKNSISAAKSWMAANQAIMNAPAGTLKTNKDYRKLINEHLNKGLLI